MPNQRPRYLAYMLRLWRVTDNDKSVWLASLESAQTGERRGFESFESLLEFLIAQMCEDDNRNCQVDEKRG